MYLKKIKSTVIVSILITALNAEKLNVRNNTDVSVIVTVRAKENKNDASPSLTVSHEIQSVVIQPNEEITVILDEKKFNNSIFSVQGTTMAAPPVVSRISNECSFSGYRNDAVFTQEGVTLICSVTQEEVDYSALNQPDKILFDLALQACKKAYAPYSNFYDGAALETMQGNTFKGCSIENTSYGATNCAERTAIFSAIAHEGAEMKIKTVVILRKNKAEEIIDRHICGICCQVINEFSTRETSVIYIFKDKITIKPFKNIFPEAFTQATISNH